SLARRPEINRSVIKRRGRGHCRARRSTMTAGPRRWGEERPRLPAFALEPRCAMTLDVARPLLAASAASFCLALSACGGSSHDSGGASGTTRSTVGSGGSTSPASSGAGASTSSSGSGGAAPVTEIDWMNPPHDKTLWPGWAGWLTIHYDDLKHRVLIYSVEPL